MVLGTVQIAVSLQDQIRSDLAHGGTPVEPVPAADPPLAPGADPVL